MKFLTPLLLAAAVLTPCAVKADSFEGTVSMELTSAKDSTPHTITYSIKGHLLRLDMAMSPTMQGSVIMDLDNRTMTILMPQQSMYMVQHLPDPQAPAGPQAQAATPDLKDTGVHEKILGYDCVKYVATTPKGSTDIWVTDQLGTFMGLSAGGPGRHQQAPQAWEQALKGKNFFPLRVESHSSSGDESFRMEVKMIERKSLSDSEFTPPEGWRKLDFGSLMQGMPQGFGQPRGN